MATQEEFDRKITEKVGINYDYYQNLFHNPKNQQILALGEHNDQWGLQAKVFSTCYQTIRQLAGPYKIFGSREINAVGSCIHMFIDAHYHVNRELQQK